MSFNTGFFIDQGVPVPKGSIDLDGVSEYYTSIYNANHEIERTDKFTVFAWVKIDTYKISLICSKFDNSGLRRGWFWRILADGTVIFNLTNNNTTEVIVVTTVASVPLNQWVFLTVTYDGSSLNTGFEIYFNGVLQAVTRAGTLTTTTVNPANVFRIGFNVAGGFFDGKIALVGLIKGVELTALEVANLGVLPYPKDSIYLANQVIWADFGSALWYNNFWLVENKADTLNKNSFQSVLVEHADQSFIDYPT